MTSTSKSEFEAVLDRILNKTGDDELLQMIDEAGASVYGGVMAPIFCSEEKISQLRPTFISELLGEILFPMVGTSIKIDDRCFDYTTLALAA